MSGVSNLNKVEASKILKKMKPSFCLLCKNKVKVNWQIVRSFQKHTTSKVPFGWMYLSPDETDPALVDIHLIENPIEIQGSGVCGKCGAICDFVGLPDGTSITTK